MELSNWHPFRELDSFFSQYARQSNDRLLGSNGNEWAPAVDIIEDDKEFTIQAELPEVKKKDIHISIDNHILSLSGERKYEKKDKKEHKIERFYGSFARSFSLPDNVDEDSIKAECKDGMLYVHLNKMPEAKVKAIEVKIS